MEQNKLEKTAFDPLSFAMFGAGGHLAQNAAAAQLAKHSKDWVPNHLLSRALGGNGVGGGNLGAVGRGASRAIVPEYGIMGDELSHAGHTIRERLASRNADGTISNRQIVNIRKALGGDFAGVARNRRNREDLIDIISAINPEAAPMIRSMAIHAEKNPMAEQKLMDFLTDLGTEYRANGFLGNIGRNMADRNVFNAKNLQTLSAGVEDATANKIEHAVENLGNAALLYTEPGIGAFNVSKKALASRKPAELAAQGNSVAQKAKDVQDWSNRVFVSEPMKESFRKGLSGQDPTLREKAMNAFQTYGMNYPIGKVNDFSRRTGHLINKHFGMTPDHLDQINALSKNPELANAAKAFKAKMGS